MKHQAILMGLLLLLNCCLCRPQESEYELCSPKASGFFGVKETVHIINSKGPGGRCKGCDELKNCTTFDGAIQIQGFRIGHPEAKEQLYFPKLTEITGHLLISLLFDFKDLRSIFPNLAVIRGRYLFLYYSLIIYQNQGLEQINLPSLTTILSGGVRIEKNINLCYVNTIRWLSIMKMTSDNPHALVTSSNNNDCYDLCYKGKCMPPAGHGASGKQYCWSPGNPDDYSCLKLCNTRCGNAGCVRGSDNQCCHSQCLGGCFQPNSPNHCYACQNLRLNTGECVEKCPAGLLEIGNFECIQGGKCPSKYFKHENRCVKDCPAGYSGKFTTNFFGKVKSHCEPCGSQHCPKVCSVPSKSTIDSISSLRKFKGCTEINGNLEIRLRGGGQNIAQELDENLGLIEEVKGYIVIRESVSIMSLQFLKNLKRIEPKKVFGVYKLQSDRYVITIMDNPKLEALWDFQPDMNITAGGILVRMNPRLCPASIDPLVDILGWRNVSMGRPVDVSQTSNGNAVACHVKNINMTVTEKYFMRSCPDVCVQVSWDEVRIKGDYRGVLFYTVSYRKAPHTKITEFDDVDACSTKKVWTRIDVSQSVPGSVNTNASDSLTRPLERKKRHISKLIPHTLYAFYVEAATLNNTGAKSQIYFLRTREMIPSSVVGLEANYLDSKSLLVKWQKPLFPNGVITKYKVEYQLSTYSVWKQEGIDWCIRQVVPGGGGHGKDDGDDDDDDKDKDGNCKVNITCNCDKEKEVIKPEKQAAIFAKEFQDALFKAIFTKPKDDNPSPTNRTSTITPTTHTAIYSNNTNCSKENQVNGICEPSTSTASSSSESPTTSTEATLAGNDTSSTNTTGVPPTTVSPKIVVEVEGNETSVKITGLRHFTDYTIKVCACTKAGCAYSTSCSDTKGRTAVIAGADDLDGEASIQVNNESRSFNLSWGQPRDPNGVVLKYNIEIRHASQSNVEVICWPGSSPPWMKREGNMYGNYSVRVRAITPAGNGSWSGLILFTIHEKTDDIDHGVRQQQPSRVGVIVGASVAAVAVFILTCALVAGFVIRKRYQEKQVPTVLYASVNPEYMNSTDVYIADEWEVPRDKIKLIKELGNGSFGMVYEGEAINIVAGESRCHVAVKTVSENASIRDRIEFLHEASIMKAFQCNHVVRLLGVVSDGQPTLVIMELMENGDLKNFLRSRRPEESALPPPSLDEMLQMAGEIADGMAYLAARKLVHRDLAARNCMVNANFTVKIGDFGMTRDIYETDYYRKGGKGLLPVRWMAPESLKDGVFTSSTDMWSFGVVMWEMATLAAQPYPGKSNEEVLKHVVDGNVMSKPDACPDRLYDFMVLCWQFNPKARPTFLSLISILEENLSEEFRINSFYHSLPSEQLKQMLKNKCHHIPRQRAETVQSELESSTSV